MKRCTWCDLLARQRQYGRDDLVREMDLFHSTATILLFSFQNNLPSIREQETHIFFSFLFFLLKYVFSLIVSLPELETSHYFRLFLLYKKPIVNITHIYWYTYIFSMTYSTVLDGQLLHLSQCVDRAICAICTYCSPSQKIPRFPTKLSMKLVQHNKLTKLSKSNWFHPLRDSAQCFSKGDGVPDRRCRILLKVVLVRR